MYLITLVIPVSGIRSNKGAEEVAQNMIEHLGDTFNDDNSLKIEHAGFRIEKGLLKRRSES